MAYDVLIRPATPDEVDLLPRLEEASGELFREVGMDLVADAAPPPTSSFAAAQRDGLLLVALTDAQLVGFVRLALVDGALHVEQLSVAPAYVRRGIGTRLMRAAEEVARARGLTRMTLTTYRDVPFNGPFYAALGWHVVPETELTPGIAEARRLEAAAGLDRWPRQAMATSVAD